MIPVLCAVASSCVNGDHYAAPDLSGECSNLTATTTVTAVTALAPTYPAYFKYTNDDIIEAYVTSSDEGGNFYKTISLVAIDGSVGFSMPIDAYNLYNRYEPGRKVYVNMKDRYIDIDHNSLVVGSLFNNDTPEILTDDKVGRISANDYKHILTRGCSKIDEEQLVIKNISVSQAKNDSYLNKLIEFDGVQFTDASNGKKYYDASLNSIGGATNHLISDVAGNTVTVRVSEYANFAGNLTPTGSGKIRGVMSKFNGTYQFMIRTENDVKLSDPRLRTIFNEDFESITATGNNQFISLPGWSNVSLNGGAERWEARIFSGNKYAQLSAFQTGETNMDTWLITPAINMDNSVNEMLYFGSKIGFANGEAVTVFISTNYSGAATASAINAATWTQLNPIMAPQTQSYPADFTSSGPVDISSYNGNVHIAFRYRGSINGVTSTYQIDNIKVTGGNN